MASPIRYIIKINGVVQGVGFRPIVYRLAARWGIKGWVKNSPGGVAIEAEGLDPLCLASEGKMVVIASPEESAHLLAIMRNHELGQEAAVIGEVVSGKEKNVYLRTNSRGTRILHPLESEMLPRIC